MQASVMPRRFVLFLFCLIISATVLSVASSAAASTAAPLRASSPRLTPPKPLPPPISESWELFHPVFGYEAMVATQDDIASEVGKAILKKGGNAIDAAVAVGFALAVTLPRAGNIGGGGFMVIWLNDKKRAVAIDYREAAPMAVRADLYLDEKGQVVEDRLINSQLAVGVPGTVAGFAYALKKYGTMSLADVMAPAIALAEQGFIVSPALAQVIDEQQVRLRQNQESAKIFFKPDGSLYKAGDTIKQKDLARSLTLIAKEGPSAFYQGEIAKKIVATMQKENGLITLRDLANYKVKERPPVVGSYRGYRIISMPPPSSGGIIVIEILNILEGFPLTKLGLNGAAYIHLLTESMNLAFHDRNAHLGDPDSIQNPTRELLSKAHAALLRTRINQQRHLPASEIIKKNELPLRESVQTTHFSIVDRAGNMVSNTYTLNYSFGNGHTVIGAGILLNNEIGDFTIRPGQPTLFGLVETDKNLIGGGKRPLSSMAPTIVLDPSGKPFMALGSPGGSRIITTVVQVLLNVIDFKLNIASALASSRIHSQLFPDQILYEQGISPDTVQMLESKGHQLELSRAMGSVQAVAIEGNHRLGASDTRRQGALATGY